jgi:hypothetical protein
MRRRIIDQFFRAPKRIKLKTQIKKKDLFGQKTGLEQLNRRDQFKLNDERS